jgi:hypothetical protein
MKIKRIVKISVILFSAVGLIIGALFFFMRFIVHCKPTIAVAGQIPLHTEGAHGNRRTVLEFVNYQLENNYIGFYMRRNRQYVEHYRERYDSIESRIDNYSTPVEFTKKVERLVEIFPDCHLRLWFSTTKKKSSTHDTLLPSFSILDSETVCLTLPSMHDGNRSHVREIYTENKAVIYNSKWVIIDIRGNTGGSDMVWMPLSPLFVFKRFRAKSMYLSFVSSRDNISKMKQNGYFQWPFTMAEKYRASLVECSCRWNIAFPVISLRFRRKPFVAIVVDKWTASAAEGIVLRALEAGNSLIFGKTNTLGCVDYGNCVYAKMPDDGGEWVLQYPLTCWYDEESYMGYDIEGIEPDVRIPEEIDDEIAYVAHYLKSRKRQEFTYSSFRR